MSLANIFITANQYITEILTKFNIPSDKANIAANYSLLLLSFLISILLFYITRWILRKKIAKHIRSSKTLWDDYLLENKIFHKASYLIPAFFLGWSIHPIFSEMSESKTILLLLLSIYKIIILAYVFNAFLDTIVQVYKEQSKNIFFDCSLYT